MNSYLEIYMEILRSKGSCAGILASGCRRCGDDMRNVCNSTSRTTPIRQARCQLALSKLLDSPYAGNVFEELL